MHPLNFAFATLVRLSALLTIGLLLSMPAYADGDNDDVDREWSAPSTYQTLWLLDGDRSLVRSQQKHLQSVLAQTDNGQHLVGEQALEDHIRNTGLQLPRCMDGTGTCSSTQEAAIQALRLQMLVHLTISDKGSVQAKVINDHGKVLQVVNAEKATTRAAVMDIVSQITGASGSMSIDTTPEGATVLINGETQGTTPFRQTLRVATYDVEIQLPGYTTEHRIIDIPPEGTIRKHITLEARQATLIIHSATPNAVVRIDNQEASREITQPILVDEGYHHITVEAPGYEPVTKQFDFRAGQTRELSATLALSMKEISRQHRERIYQRPVMLQAGLRYMHNSTDWHGARSGQEPLHVQCATRPTTGECQTAPLHAIGLDLELMYAWKFVELEALGISFYSLQQPSNGIDFKIDAHPELTLSHIGGSRTLIRIAHVGVRHLINDTFEPYARVGFSFAADRFQAENLMGDKRIYPFKRAGVLMELRGGLRVHIHELLYGYGEIGVGFDLRNGDGTSPAFQAGLGVGVNLASPFQRKGGKHDTDDAIPEAIPEEL